MTPATTAARDNTRRIWFQSAEPSARNSNTRPTGVDAVHLAARGKAVVASGEAHAFARGITPFGHAQCFGLV